MIRIRVRRGLDLPVPGAPAQEIEPARPPRAVAWLGDDFPGVRPELAVEQGDRVRAGETLLVDRRRPDVRFTAPVAGRVAAIHRGERRRIVALEIAPESGGGGADAVGFPRVSRAELSSLSRERVTSLLLASGDWVALRTRPFGRIPTPGSVPAAVFVRAMDTNPLAADAAVVLRGREEDLRTGLAALARLTEGRVYVCARPGSLPELDEPQVAPVEVRGPHPAGLPGTHVHDLHPVSAERRVWTVSYQDVLAIGRVLGEGCPDPARVVSLAGPAVRRPRLLRTVLGASTEDLVRGELADGACRIVSGPLLSGRIAARPAAFLGRRHEQLGALPERAPDASRARWLPGWRWSCRVSRWRGAWSSELHGEPRAFYPLDAFDSAFPMRLPIAPLLRALASGDAWAAARLGALELEEEDLALCAHLCPAKLAYGSMLRRALDELEEALP